VQVERVGPARKDVDPEALREKLERIQQEVHSIIEKQRPPPEDLDTTRLAMDEIAGTLEHAQRQFAEAKAAEEALTERIAATDRQLQEAQRRCQDAEKREVEVNGEHALARQNLSQTARALEAAAATKDSMEEELKNIQRANEKTRTLGGQMAQRCQELEGSEHDVQQRLQAASQAALRADAEKHSLQAGLAAVRQQTEEAIRQASQGLDRTASLEDELLEERAQQAAAERSQAEAEEQLQACRQRDDEEAERVQQAGSNQIRQLWELERQLRDNHAGGRAGLSPGALLKASISREKESQFAENARLRKTLCKMQTDLHLCVRRYNEQRDAIKKYQSVPAIESSSSRSSVFSLQTRDSLSCSMTTVTTAPR
jgi:chromosome segregation ATPase